MKKLFLLSLLACSQLMIRAQTPEDSVKNAVNKLFEGIKGSNAGIILASFCDSAILQSIATDAQGKAMVITESVTSFADQVSKLPAGAADERITIDVIRKDGPLAMVWAPYTFYYNGAFSHCGVDCFQLVKIKGEWKIQYLIDTRHRKGCE